MFGGFKMSVFIKETSNMDLSEYLKESESVFLRTGRSNTVRVDNKMEIHDVRAIHISENGKHCEFRVYYDEDSHSDSIYVYDVEEIIVTSVYWSKKCFFDEEED